MKPMAVAFLVVLAFTFLVLPLAVEGQQPAGKVYRVGLISPGIASPSTLAPSIGAFREELRGRGWVEGQIVVEHRSAEGKPERLPDLAAELVRLKVDAIVAVSDPAIRAARDATKTIPIIMAFTDDPVARGFVASLARPGGNITGLTLEAGELNAKRLELLKEALPTVPRIAFLVWAGSPSAAPVIRAVQGAARTLGIQLRVVEVREATEYDTAFAAMTHEHIGGLFVQSHPIFFRDHRRIIDLAARHRLPTLCEWREMAEAGCLMSYGASLSALLRRAAVFVDKILQGAKPADLPVEQPTKFELAINLQTAKAFGLTIPRSVLLRADDLIQ